MEGYGGDRPQLVDASARSLDMGGAKIVGEVVIFNVTPSPGASTCRKNAMRDTRTVVEFLDGKYAFDEDAFRADTIDNFQRAEPVEAESADAEPVEVEDTAVESADAEGAEADEDGERAGDSGPAPAQD